MSTRTDYRTGLPVPEKLAGVLYSPWDLFEAKLASDHAPVVAMMADMEARRVASVAASKASISAQLAGIEAEAQARKAA